MAPRPALAALGCFQCRTAVLRAFASASQPALRVPITAPKTTRRPLAFRGFATARTAEDGTDSAGKPASEPEERTSTDEAKSAQDSVPEHAPPNDASDVPWYLQVEPPLHAPTHDISPLPDLPEESPPVLEPLMKYVYEDMGLDDLTLLDLREVDPPPALGGNLLMLFGTARSERHLHISSSRLVKWLRNNHRIDAKADGLIGPGELKTKLRRLRKKQKLLGSNAVPTGGDDGITTGWICVNLGTLGIVVDEAARYDEDGNISGFGAPVTGTTVIVQVMTESRRTELNLEQLWGGQLKRSKQVERKAELEAEEEQFFRKFGKRPPPANSKRNRSPALAQRRDFSTSARILAKEKALSERRDPLSGPRSDIDAIRRQGADIAPEQCLELLCNIFSARFSQEQEDLSAEQASLAVSLLETMYERGMSVLNHDTIITIIETLVRSGATGPRARQVQSNLEYVLPRAVRACPTEDHTRRLLAAYLEQGDQDRFWDAWHAPTRYGAPRSQELYVFVLGSLAATQSPKWCAAALRTCVPDMPREEEPVLPIGRLWTAILECIRVVDPGAEEVAKSFEDASQEALEGKDKHTKRRLKSEFVTLYKKLDQQRVLAGSR